LVDINFDHDYKLIAFLIFLNNFFLSISFNFAACSTSIKYTPISNRFYYYFFFGIQIDCLLDSLGFHIYIKKIFWFYDL
jgi:hypothetical protein